MSQKSDDLVVEFAESPTKAAPPAGAAARAKEWLDKSPRNKWVAGGALATLLVIPLIAGPAAVASKQQQAQHGPKKRVPDWGVYRGAGSKNAYFDPLGNPDAGGQSGLGGYKLPKGMKIPNFGSLADTNATIKVPKGRKRKTPPGTLPKFGSEAVSPFVRIVGDQFDKDCRPFYPTGFNAFELFILAAEGQRDAVDEAFKQARTMGMTAARTWAHSIHGGVPFQTSPGVYDPSGLQALDYVVDSAARHGIHLILSFIDNWKYYNGVAQFVDWCGPARTMSRPTDQGGDTDERQWGPDQKRYEAGRHAQFFSEPRCQQMFQDHVKFIVNRKNSINGRVYKDDPTILAWNLINEPRCEVWVTPDCPAKLNAWYSKMARYVKSVDPNHLVSSGSEGFFGDSDPSWLGKNPASWATQTGQDFLANTAEMDFAVAHAWPDNWMISQENQGGFLKQWLQSHLDAAKSIGKPFLFEEFGKRLDSDNPGDVANLRDPVFRSTFAAIEGAVEDNEPLLGSMYWKWAFPGASRFVGTGKGPYGVDPSDSTMKIIRDHSATMYKLMGSVPPRPTCIAAPRVSAAAPVPAAAPGALGAWFGTPAGVCANDPQAAMAWYVLYGPDAQPNAKPSDFDFPAASLERAKKMNANTQQVFASQAACCAPGTGAFTSGCKK